MRRFFVIVLTLLGIACLIFIFYLVYNRLHDRTQAWNVFPPIAGIPQHRQRDHSLPVPIQRL